MKKQILLAACFMLSSHMAFATTSMVCNDGKGRELSVQMNDVETTVPFYDVVLKLNGRTVKKFEVLQKEDSPKKFMAEMVNEADGKITTVGYIYSMKQGFYQLTANEGMSPLPPIMFTNCTLK